jgi:2-(1,2-epoxy-1,2-dihydrophenyl)acetyl-CoA isomerase
MNDNNAAITLTVDNGIARMVLNRPEQGNSIGLDFIDAFDAATLECSERSNVRAVLITANGPRFCVGGDIDDMVSTFKDGNLPSYIRKCNAKLQGSLARLQHMAAPSIVAVQGSAAGGGVSLLASCDIVVSSGTARFVVAYPSIGLCCDMGGSTMLTRRLGMARARRFYLLHEQLDAITAEKIGLVDILVAPDALTAAAEAIAQRWASGPTSAYGEIRRLMLTAQDTPYETQMELETQALAKLARSDDAKEALQAFLDKRAPKFVGH